VKSFKNERTNEEATKENQSLNKSREFGSTTSSHGGGRKQEVIADIKSLIQDYKKDHK